MKHIKSIIYFFGSVFLSTYFYVTVSIWDKIVAMIAYKLHIVETLQKRFPKHLHRLNFIIRLCLSGISLLLSITVDFLLILILYFIISLLM